MPGETTDIIHPRPRFTMASAPASTLPFRRSGLIQYADINRARGRPRGLLLGTVLAWLCLLADAAPAQVDEGLMIPRDNIFDASRELAYQHRSRLSRQMTALEETFDMRVAVAFFGYAPPAEAQWAARTLAQEMLPEDRPGLLAAHNRATGEVTWHVRPAPWAAFIAPHEWNEVQAEVSRQSAVGDIEVEPVDQMLSALAMMAVALPSALGTSQVDPRELGMEVPLLSADGPSPAEVDTPGLMSRFWRSRLPLALLLVVVAVSVAFAIQFHRSLLQVATDAPEVHSPEEKIAPLWFPQVSVGQRLGAPFGGGLIGLSLTERPTLALSESGASGTVPPADSAEASAAPAKSD